MAYQCFLIHENEVSMFTIEKFSPNLVDNLKIWRSQRPGSSVMAAELPNRQDWYLLAKETWFHKTYTIPDVIRLAELVEGVSLIKPTELHAELSKTPPVQTKDNDDFFD